VGALAADHRGLIRAFHSCSRFRKKPAITSSAAPAVNLCRSAVHGPRASAGQGGCGGDCAPAARSIHGSRAAAKPGAVLSACG
jgi:hypothetical protein